MSEITVHDAISLALEHQRAGELADAEGIYRQILSVFPDQADALHLLGVLLHEQAKTEEAREFIEQAIALKPQEANYRLTRGMVQQSERQFEQAVVGYRELVALHPGLADAHAHMGVALSMMGRHFEAVPALQEALRLAPNNAMTQGNLGIALCHVKRFAQAIEMLQQAVAQLPGNQAFRSALGTALFSTGRLEESVAQSREAVRLMPERGDAYLTLSTALNGLERREEALTIARKAVELLPGLVDVYVNLGETLRQLGRPDECIDVYRGGLVKFGESAPLLNSLGNVLKDVGELDEAMTMYRRAIKVHLDPALYSNLLYTMQYHPTMDAGEIYREHREYDRIFAEPLAKAAREHSNDPTMGRRLKVGYISSELRGHALGHYLTPLLANHERAGFEIFAYSDTRMEDGTTRLLQRSVDRWKQTRDLDDAALAELVRHDQIDILVDLHQHMGANRLLVFARKPAPVQIGFAGYPGTTGLTSIEYRLTDLHLEPPDGFPVPSTETPILLPETWWCYTMRAAMVPVSELPAAKNGYVTFGNLNNFCKVNAEVLRTWAAVMTRVPKSRLILLTSAGRHREKVWAFMEAQGVARDRVEFVTWQVGSAYFELYHRIDVGLDTFPYNGHTTSLDSFFMGVPVVTLAGAEGTTPVGRAGLSQLLNLRLEDLASFSHDEFVDIAVKLATDMGRMEELRRGLRERMNGSALMDGPRFARNVEGAYRLGWQRWCQRRTRPS